MADLTAQLLAEGAVLAESVPVELTTDPHDPDGTRWHGRFQIPPRMTLAIGSRCLLRLADGRQGEIEVTRLAYGRATDDIRVFFRGQGPLR